MSFPVEVRPLTLYGIEGHLLRCNDAVFHPALPSSAEPRALAKQRTLVFFGGDIQNLSHLMDPTDKVIDYRKWCLEATAVRLGSEFPSCHIVVIKPSRVVFDHISCFDNFVESNHIGIPKHYYHYLALVHLEKLLQTISKTIRQMDSDVLFKMLLETFEDEQLPEKHQIENGTGYQYENMPAERKRVLINWQKKLRLHNYPQTLVAFSKGCVVLNQFLYEFHYARSLEPHHNQDSCFIERIKHMYWLDSGNCGRQNVYLTSRGLLRTLAYLEIIVHVHVSMYMTEDENRPWIGKQFNNFIKGIREFKGNVMHFRHISPTDDLKSHFEVLLQFKYTEKRHINSLNSPKVRRQRKPPPDLELPAPPPPVARERIPATPRSKQPSHNESIGLCLVNLHDSPYLGLQISVQKHGLPLKATEARLSCPPHPNFVQTVPSRYRSTLSSSQMPATSAGLPISTQRLWMPGQTTTSAHMPATSAMVRHEPTSVHTPSNPVQTTTPAQMPATSAMVRHEPTSVHTPSTPVQTTTPAQMPATSAMVRHEPTSVHTPSTPVQTTTPAQMPATSAEPSMMSAPTPSTPFQTNSAQMPSTPAEPSMSGTPVQKPPPSGLVWSSGQLPKNHKDYTVLLLNEISYSFSDEEAIDYKNSPYYNIHAPVVALPNHRNPLRLHVYAPEKEIYVPSVYNHHYVVNRKNEKDQGEDLPPFFVDGEPPPAADDLDPAASGPTNATATSVHYPRYSTYSSMPSRSGRSATTGPMNPPPSPRADISSPFSYISESSAFDMDSDSSVFGSASGASVFGTASDASVSGSASDASVSDLASDASVFGLASHASGSASDASAADSDHSSSSGTSSPVNSRIGSRSGLGRTLNGLSQFDAVSFSSPSGPARSDAGLGSHSTSVTQLEPNTADQPVLSQRATSRSVTRRDVSQNLVDTPRNEIDTQSTQPGSHVASSSQDSVAPRAGTSGARVRARDVDDEPPCRYNLRKRIKRSYDENILNIQYK